MRLAGAGADCQSLQKRTSATGQSCRRIQPFLWGDLFRYRDCCRGDPSRPSVVDSLNLNSEIEQVVLVLIVAPKLFIEPGAKAKVVNAFERERPPDCE